VVRPVLAIKKFPHLGCRLENAVQTGYQIRAPRGPGEGDVALIEVDSPLRIPVDLQDAGDVLAGEAHENGGQPRARLVA